MTPCSDCVNFVAIGDGTTGECHFDPPKALGDYLGLLGAWAIVLGTDECGQFDSGVHPGEVCSTCTRFDALTPSDTEYTQCTGAADDNSLCGDAKCIAVVFAASEQKGELSIYPTVNTDTFRCSQCYVPIP